MHGGKSWAFGPCRNAQEVVVKVCKVKAKVKVKSNMTGAAERAERKAPKGLDPGLLRGEFDRWVR